MSWDWVTPASGAAFGIATVIAGLVSARSAQRFQERLASAQRAEALAGARRAERKAAFVACLHAATDLDAKAFVGRVTRMSGYDAEAENKLFYEILALKVRLQSTVDELAVVASAATSTTAYELLGVMDELLKLMIDHDQATLVAVRSSYVGCRTRLLDLIREELDADASTSA